MSPRPNREPIPAPRVRSQERGAWLPLLVKIFVAALVVYFLCLLKWAF